MRKVAVAVLMLVAIASFYPEKYSVCPAWTVTVQDESGKPVPGMTVRRSCNDYSVGIHREEDRRTDLNGKTSFDPLTVRGPRALRWGGNFINVVTQGVHASFGCHSYVFAFGRGLEGSPVRGGYVEVWEGTPVHMESRIVAAPVIGLTK